MFTKELISRFHSRASQGLIAGWLLFSLLFSSCNSSGVDKENLNNNGAGADQDATRISPDTIETDTMDTLLNPRTGPAPTRIDSLTNLP